MLPEVSQSLAYLDTWVSDVLFFSVLRLNRGFEFETKKILLEVSLLIGSRFWVSDEEFFY